MQEQLHLRFQDSSDLVQATTPPDVLNQRWSLLAEQSILILGAPRSGTTWLAKIFDSHPDIIYRHEPDEIAPANSRLSPSAQIALWLSQRGLRSAGKRPHFIKSWRSGAAHAARGTLAAALLGANRLPLLGTATPLMRLPDFLPYRSSTHVRGAMKLVNWNGSAAARAMPGLRCVVILRHPCGQVHSVLTGRASRQFRDTGGAVVGSAEARAAESGIGRAEFAALPEAGRLAYAWLAFNEALLRELGAVPNARFILYEDLCRNPERMAQNLFNFAGLAWNGQTERFLRASTQDDRGSGYFDVFRASAATAERWRASMHNADQDAVRSVVASSEIAQFWPDFPSHITNGNKYEMISHS